MTAGSATNIAEAVRAESVLCGRHSDSVVWRGESRTRQRSYHHRLRPPELSRYAWSAAAWRPARSTEWGPLALVQQGEEERHDEAIAGASGASLDLDEGGEVEHAEVQVVGVDGDGVLLELRVAAA